MKSEYIIDDFKFIPYTRLVFLDIDGVLNNQLYYQKMNQHERRKKSEILFPEEGDGIPIITSDIDPINVSHLNSLIEDVPDLYFIISSTWRAGRTIEELQKLFDAVGLKGTVIGKTPSLRSDNWGTIPRGAEINAWIGKFCDMHFRDSNHFVIFDDDSDMLLWQKNNYFWIDSYVGLTPNIIYQAKRFLNGEGIR